MFQTIRRPAKGKLPGFTGHLNKAYDTWHVTFSLHLFSKKFYAANYQIEKSEDTSSGQNGQTVLRWLKTKHAKYKSDQKKKSLL